MSQLELVISNASKQVKSHTAGNYTYLAVMIVLSCLC